MARKSKDYTPGPFDRERGFRHKAAWGHLRQALHKMDSNALELLALIEAKPMGRDIMRSPRLALLAAIWHFAQLSDDERYKAVYACMRWETARGYERVIREAFGVPLTWKTQGHPGAAELQFDHRGLLSGVAIDPENSFNEHTLKESVSRLLAMRVEQSPDEAGFRDAMRKLGFDMEAA